MLCLAVRQWDILTLNEESARSLGQKSAPPACLRWERDCAGLRDRERGRPDRLYRACRSPSGPPVRRGPACGLIPLVALWGSALLVGADTVARMFINAYGELPVGAITAMIGAPCLIWLAMRVSRSLIGGRGSSGGSIMAGTSLRRIPYPALVTLFSVAGAGMGIQPDERQSAHSLHGRAGRAYGRRRVDVSPDSAGVPPAEAVNCRIVRHGAGRQRQSSAECGPQSAGDPQVIE